MIELRGVGVTYAGGATALRDVTLRFGSGEFTVLLGVSGAGKSTLLRCLNGLVRPTTGEVHAAGVGRVTTARALAAHRRRTAMIFQQHQLIGRLSALRNVLTGRLGHHGSLRTILPWARADQVIALECLDRVGLLERALDRVETLSGGMQQRVGIARALAQRPTFVLADEPVASLDPGTAARALGLLHTICKSEGIGAVVSLHQFELARQFADRLVGIARGRVVFDGAVDDLDGPAFERVFGVARDGLSLRTEEVTP